MVEAAINEIQDQQRMETNLMVFGQKEDTSAEDDRVSILAVMDAVGVDRNAITSMQQLCNPQDDKKRPVKLRLTTMEVKRAALSKAKSLRNGTFRYVYLKPDLTPLQLKKHSIGRGFESCNCGE